ncbi:hypothetical protein LS71_005470 [Helicobacter jaachi]|uniref:Impact N-terminal domain-containing protein n=1 Tax=Helicobacter jaachi TaxID=1677920 RepID=A0A4U8TCZ9_9HELI|nr:YigZ family protein [Helicobacter jaachi]TLD96517.1 hypothetical protein LS71_005470 [Helicobacter jaachi]
MKTIFTPAQGSFEAKGSKFLSFLVPFSDFENLCQQLRAEHTKAVHFVRASRYLNEYEQIIESFDDDREPKGSSGRPSLNVLRGEGLINVGVVIVRYFGGTLLGVGGLVRAYTAATQAAIESAFLQDFMNTQSLEVSIPYALLSQYEYEAKKLNIALSKEAFLPHAVRIKMQGEKCALDVMHKKLQALQHTLDSVIIESKP